MVNRKLQGLLMGLSSALALAGCATLSKDQCLMGDWYDIGIQDGAEGYSPSRLAQHQEACAEFRVRPDRGAYQAGWDRGIGEYCTRIAASRKAGGAQATLTSARRRWNGLFWRATATASSYTGKSNGCEKWKRSWSGRRRKPASGMKIGVKPMKTGGGATPRRATISVFNQPRRRETSAPIRKSCAARSSNCSSR